MQRLFSTFADGWPGRGLFLLRFLTAAALIHGEVMGLPEAPPFAAVLPRILKGGLGPGIVGIAAAALLLIGLWTPVAGVAVAIVEVWIAFSLHFSRSGDPWLPLMLAALGVILAMVGPGAWSIDARLFGRKHIDI